jgi:CPA1 family monovalent cation:H+ antiporter
MISSGLFLLAGRAVPGALAGLGQWPVWQVVATALCVLGIALAVQFSFALAATRMAPIRAALAEHGDPSTSPWAAATVMTWSSTRSVIALLIALSIPTTLPGGATFDERSLILALTSLIVIGSLLIQGVSLPHVVRRAGLADASDDEEEETNALAAVREAASSPAEEPETKADAARQRLVHMREQDEIGDEVMTAMMREVDLTARAAEKNPLPGSGPPQP